MDELPKTAVGKIFKPDLRKRAIKRIFDQALEAAGLEARVDQVVDDKKKGLVAKITAQDSDVSVHAAIGDFVGSWERM